MECEVRALRKELEETRQALRLQTVRCRQLVAAFTSKLQEKEREVAAGRTLRDQQLSRVLRALIVLEARLRREQRVIRQQLADRDSLIQAQQEELDTLRKLQEEKNTAEENPKEKEPEVQEETKEEPKPVLPEVPADDTPHATTEETSEPVTTETVVEAPASSSTEEEEPPARPFRPTSQSTAFVRFRKNTRSRIHTQQGSYRPVTRRKAAAAALAHQDHGGVDDEELGTRDLYKDYQHNPVLECVNQILLRDHDEMMEKPEKRFSYHCPSIQEEQENSTEEEETPAQQQSEVLSSKDKTPSPPNKAQPSVDETPQSEAWPSKDKTPSPPLKALVLEETPTPQSEVWTTKDKTPSPPIKAQLLEEKACLLMASQRLTLVRNPEFEEVDKENEPLKSPPPPLPPPHAKNLTPPALPPKPTQLGGKGYHPLLFPRKMNGTNHHHHHVNGNTYPGRGIKPELKTIKQTETKTLSHHHGHTHNSDKQQNPSPSRQRQILSNGSLKLALGHDVGQENGRGPLFDHHHHHNHHHYNHNHQEKNNNNTFEEKLDNLSDVTNTRHRKGDDGRTSTKTLKNGNATVEELVSAKQQGGNTALNKSPSHCGKIRVGSSVSSLITGSCGNSIVNELTKGESEAVQTKLALPRVSQIVRRFEDLGTSGSTEKDRTSPVTKEEVKDEEAAGDDDDDGNNTLRHNFEEFRLEDVDMDSVGDDEEEDRGRPAGDGAESRSTVVIQNGTAPSATVNGVAPGSGGSYEHFLEATGLSQKSILTPSRMLSNHRSVLKPKDVKHRSKVLKAAAGVTTGPVVKYWIEPFL